MVQRQTDQPGDRTQQCSNTQPQANVNATRIQSQKEDEEGFITVQQRSLARPPPNPVTAAVIGKVITYLSCSWKHKKGHQIESKRRGFSAMDRICSWNIRGLNQPNKQEDIKIFLSNKHIGLVGLLEIKVKERNVEKVANRLFQGWKWQHHFQLSTKGRIWVAWKPGQYHVQIISMIEQYIHCKATQITTMKGFFITFVCGANQAG